MYEGGDRVYERGWEVCGAVLTGVCFFIDRFQ